MSEAHTAEKAQVEDDYTRDETTMDPLVDCGSSCCMLSC